MFSMLPLVRADRASSGRRTRSGIPRDRACLVLVVGTLLGAQAACTTERITTVPSETTAEPDSDGVSGPDDDQGSDDGPGSDDDQGPDGDVRAIDHGGATGTHAGTTIRRTVSSNPNRVLKVDVISGLVAQVTGISSDVDGALTFVVGASTGAVGVQSFLLVNPTEGSHTLTVSFSGGGESNNTVILVTEIQGVHQSTPIRGTPAADDGTGTAPSVTVETAAGDLVVDALFSYQDASRAGADQNLRGNTFVSPNYHGHTSEQAGDAGGSMSYVLAETTPWAMIAYSLIPADDD